MTEISVHEDADDLARAMALDLADRLTTIQATGQVPQLVLTGGTIASTLYAALADVPGPDWGRVEVWWGDERYVAADSEDRNDAQARTALLDRVGVDPDLVHPMPAEDGSCTDVDAAASSYAETVRGSGADHFDIVLLGLGPDGHVASLFPGSTQVHVEDRAVVAVTDSPKPPPQRISLTMPCLNRTEEVWFVVSGEGKADAVARSLSSEGTVAQTPARGITATSRWYLDTGAASLL